MKTGDNDQSQQARISEGMKLIFDQGTPSTSRSSSSSRDSSYSSSQSSSASYRSRRSKHRCPRHRSRSSSNSDSSSESHSRSRSRPRCHRSSGRSRCQHQNRYTPQCYRASSHSCSPSPDRSSHRGRTRHRALPCSRSSSRESCCRRRRSSRSYSSRRSRFVDRYRCRFSPSPRKSHRDYRGRSRSPERSAVRLSQKEKIALLNIAKENAAKILGVINLELPASVRFMGQQQKQQEENPGSNIEEEVKVDPMLLKKSTQGQNVENEDKSIPRLSPTTKPITFSINNTVAKPSGSPTFHVTESKVTSRADSMGNRKPYGQWVPVKKLSPKTLSLPQCKKS